MSVYGSAAYIHLRHSRYVRAKSKHRYGDLLKRPTYERKRKRELTSLAFMVAVIIFGVYVLLAYYVLFKINLDFGVNVLRELVSLSVSCSRSLPS